jgi:chitodextrinase
MKPTLLVALLALSFGGLSSSAVADEMPALTPVIGVNPTILDFGSVCLGECRDRVLLIFNDVQDSQSLLAITELTAIGAPILVDPPATPFYIPGDGTTVPVTLRFCVESPGGHDGTLIVLGSNAENSPLAVPLIAAGNRPPFCVPNGPYEGTVGEPVTFDGTGSSDPDGGALAYAWSFGDGTTGSGSTPTHTYGAPGVYTIGLTVTDDCATTSTCQTVAQISAPPQNIPPVCNTGGAYFGSVGQPVTFNGSGSRDPDGIIMSYTWTFGDGNTGSGAQVTHSYAVAGNYAVGLCVVDDDSAQACCQTTAHIAPCGTCPPSSQIEGEPPCQDGYVDNFNGGCNSTPPVFSVASCNTICGETGTYILDGQPRSDTDWYRMTVGPGAFSYRGIAAGFVLRLDVRTNQCPSVILSTTTSPSCEQSAPLAFNGPGTFVMVASPDDLTGVSCPSEYVLIITGPGIPPCDTTPAENTTWGHIKARYRH